MQEVSLVAREDVNTLIECPHCLTKIFYDNKGNCPCCGVNKYKIPTLTKQQILYEKEKSDKNLILSHVKKVFIWEYIGGGIALLWVLCFILMFALTGVGAVYHGLFILGLALVVKATYDLKDFIKLKNEYNKLYKKNKNEFV